VAGVKSAGIKGGGGVRDGPRLLRKWAKRLSGFIRKATQDQNEEKKEGTRRAQGSVSGGRDNEKGPAEQKGPKNLKKN